MFYILTIVGILVYLTVVHILYAMSKHNQGSAKENLKMVIATDGNRYNLISSDYYSPVYGMKIDYLTEKWLSVFGIEGSIMPSLNGKDKFEHDNLEKDRNLSFYGIRWRAGRIMTALHVLFVPFLWEDD